MRWESEITLVAKAYEPDDEGVMRPTETRTTVFCNVFSVGVQTWDFYHERGIAPDAEVQVHTFEYDDQRDALFEGKWYSVETVKREGDYTRLVLRHQMSDSEEEGSGDEQNG